jgi:segregation and condensation protein A
MENPNYHLEGIVREKNELQDFEGPLSLILMLLAKNKIEIRDLKIADILDQYLDYLARMQSMDLEIASEFVQMASHLLYIKTKTLLSADEEEPSELELLMQSLEQLRAKDTLASIEKLMPQLREAAERGLQYYTKLPEPQRDAGVYAYRHEPVDLLRALYHVYARGGSTVDAREVIRAVPSRIVYSVRDKSRELLERLKKGRASMRELYESCTTRSEVVATFISVLELCSIGSLRLRRRGRGYSVEFVGGSVDEILEKIVE